MYIDEGNTVVILDWDDGYVQVLWPHILARYIDITFFLIPFDDKSKIFATLPVDRYCIEIPIELRN